MSLSPFFFDKTGGAKAPTGNLLSYKINKSLTVQGEFRKKKKETKKIRARREITTGFESIN